MKKSIRWAFEFFAILLGLIIIYNSYSPLFLEQTTTDIAICLSLVTSFAAILSGISDTSGLFQFFEDHQNAKLLQKKLSQGPFDKSEIISATRFYIPPKFTNIDPAQEQDFRRALVASKNYLFPTIDQFLDKDDSKRHLLILADSGIGKTSFVLNYYVHNERRRSSRHDIVLVAFGKGDADKRIKGVENKEQKVIFLDALDEDILAVNNIENRVHELMQLCCDFKKVIITCRSQFFKNDEEIPKETGIAVIGSRALGQSPVYAFWKLYLSPFDDEDIDLYLKKRYSIFNRKKRKIAKQLIDKIGSLSVRPMLLAHIPEIIKTESNISEISDIFEIIVDAWIKRESDWKDKEALRIFSEKIAVDLYIHRQERGSERIPSLEIKKLADEWKISIPDWKLTGRSLLNRDSNGNFKFAHRSIMEYLFVCQLLSQNKDCLGRTLTDQMISFYIVNHGYGSHYLQFLMYRCDGFKINKFTSKVKPYKVDINNFLGVPLYWVYPLFSMTNTHPFDFLTSTGPPNREYRKILYCGFIEMMEGVLTYIQHVFFTDSLDISKINLVDIGYTYFRTFVKYKAKFKKSGDNNELILDTEVANKVMGFLYDIFTNKNCVNYLKEISFFNSGVAEQAWRCYFFEKNMNLIPQREQKVIILEIPMK